MKVRKSSAFFADFECIARWYVREAGTEVAQKWLEALDATVEELESTLGLGRLRRFPHPELQGLRSFRVQRPFHRYLVFYRWSPEELSVERVMHGSRDLPHRLLESVAATSD